MCGCTNWIAISPSRGRGSWVDVRAAALADLEHAEGEIAGHDVDPGVRVGLAGGAGAGRQIEDALPRNRADRVEDDLAPPPRLPEGQDIVDHVVLRRNIVEHGGYFFGTLVERGSDRCAAHRLIVANIRDHHGFLVTTLS